MKVEASNFIGGFGTGYGRLTFSLIAVLCHFVPRQYAIGELVLCQFDIYQAVLVLSYASLSLIKLPFVM